ncbi:MAG: cation-translocating P-type ATPase [Clostridium sp.]|nr:cation-translocating P-type ATPase [Clostridium sp.]
MAEAFETKTTEETGRLLHSTDPGGLSAEEARKRLEQYGPNRLQEPEQSGFFSRLLSQFMDPLIYVLAAAGVISVFLGEIGDACIIAAVAALNGAVGMIQEGKAKKALDALKKMTRLKAVVRRDQTDQEIDAAELVPGDLVVLDAGRQVPADLRLLWTEGLRAEESALTGEAAPVHKDAGFSAAAGLPVGDRKNMAYMSSNVTAGRGIGMVTATGMDTEIGRIARLIREAPMEATPLQKRLGDLGGALSILAVALCAALFGLAVWQKRDVGEMLITAISLAVAAVPEGLPAVVTIVLALSVSRMARVHTIVRRLPSVETLGAVSVVCSDKTGTLTMNRMTVEEVLDAGELLDEGGSGRRRRSGRGKWATTPGQEELLRAFVLCNDAELNKKGRIGDPGELALLEYAEKEGPWTKGELERQLPRTAERAFDPERKRMTTVHRTETGAVSYTKGAPDVILERCSRYLSGGGERPLTGSSRRRLQDRISWLSGQGLRVLGAARSDGDGRKEEDMVFLGLAAMADPPRPEAAHAVAMFKRAHVRTVMITGDHRDTALAIARRLGIAEDGSQCISGAELDRMDDAALKERAETAAVFSRVSPDHKVRIVRALKENGSIVAMTGDGVNDAPSLKAADVGIAMGQTGTDVAKQAADMVLTDDDFATIEKAIEEGRGVYENIKKAVIFLLSSNFGEIMTMFTAIALSLPSPLKASHILWINLITDSLPALALGTDKNDGPALMEEPPRGKDESLFSRGGMACTLFYGFLIAVISLTAFLRLPVGILAAEGRRITVESLSLVLGDPAVLARCQTYAFTVLGLSQLFHAVGMRDVGRSVFRMNHLENRLMLAAATLGVFLQVLVTENSRLVALFQTAALSGTEWRELLFLAAAPLAAHELLAGLSRISGARGTAGKEWTGS